MNEKFNAAQLTPDEEYRLDLVLKNSTPGDRLNWLDDMRLLFGIDHIRRCQEIKWKMQHESNAKGSDLAGR